jgi:hypothetical protein
MKNLINVPKRHATKSKPELANTILQAIFYFTNPNSKTFLIEEYPAQYLNKKFQNDMQDKLDTVLRQLHPDIDPDVTLLLSNKGLDKSNELDAQPTNEMSFRIKNITQNLPTLDKLQKVYKKELDNICPRCNTEIEDQNHIWSCKNSMDQLQQLSGNCSKKAPSHMTEKNYAFSTSNQQYQISIRFSQ